jgi:hypothetical protein
MNKSIGLIFLMIILLTDGIHGQYRQRARHGYLKTETVVNDLKDPENNRKVVEVNDKKGRLLQLTEFNEKGKKVKDLTYQYDKHEKTCLHKDANDSIKLKEHWQYDAQKRVVEYCEMDYRKKNETKTKTTYNKWGEKAYEWVYRNDQLIKKRVFTYNAEGLLIEQKTENADGQLIYQKNYTFLP